VTRASRLLVALVLAATAVFALGVILERHQTAKESVERAANTETPAERNQNGEAGKSGETGATGESTEPTRTGESTAPTNAPSAPAGGRAEHRASSERLLGINPESTGLLAVAVAVSLLLTAAVWRAGASPWVLAVVAVAMAGFCALDVREVIHQADESRTGLAVLAVVVAALHLAAALLAGRAAIGARQSGPPLAPSAHAT
jgi:Flp pilus assembly protein TadB